jgi:TPP-dependent pyruvate/acetoin dehydrogenase alpha subunit
MGTALARSESQLDLCLKAASYGMPAWPVDGMDVLAVEAATRQAALAARAGGGPVFLELRTYRFRAHSMFDPELYRERSEVERWKERDPIRALEERLRCEGALDDAALAELERGCDEEIARAVEFAEAGTLEPVSELTRFVTSDRSAA